jgi:hypothetical protein
VDSSCLERAVAPDWMALESSASLEPRVRDSPPSLEAFGSAWRMEAAAPAVEALDSQQRREARQDEPRPMPEAWGGRRRDVPQPEAGAGHQRVDHWRESQREQPEPWRAWAERKTLRPIEKRRLVSVVRRQAQDEERWASPERSKQRPSDLPPRLPHREWGERPKA